MIKTIALSTLLILLGTGAAVAGNTDPTPTGRENAIVNGKRLQPRPTAGQNDREPDSAAQLLQQGASNPAADAPVVVPRDMYGNPLGGNPGLNPPGLTPQQKQTKP
jgi:hypothetical protein